SALAAETELGPATDEFLDVLEEPRAIGFVLVRDELSGRVLLVLFRIELGRGRVQARQPSSSPIIELGFERAPAPRARNTADRRAPPHSSVERSPPSRAGFARKVGTNQTSASCWWLVSPETPTPTSRRAPGRSASARSRS